jgi:hypothetical protein
MAARLAAISAPQAGQMLIFSATIWSHLMQIFIKGPLQENFPVPRTDDTARFTFLYNIMPIWLFARHKTRGAGKNRCQRMTEIKCLLFVTE